VILNGPDLEWLSISFGFSGSLSEEEVILLSDFPFDFFLNFINYFSCIKFNNPSLSFLPLSSSTGNKL